MLAFVIIQALEKTQKAFCKDTGARLMIYIINVLRPFVCQSIYVCVCLFERKLFRDYWTYGSEIVYTV